METMSTSDNFWLQTYTTAGFVVNTRTYRSISRVFSDCSDEFPDAIYWQCFRTNFGYRSNSIAENNPSVKCINRCKLLTNEVFDGIPTYPETTRTPSRN